MQDIPVFTTEHGAAGLVLREIPYKGVAYITLHDTLSPEELLQECVNFCKMAGAEHIYATGHPMLEQYPLHTALWKMSSPRAGLGQTDAVLRPVTADTAENWRKLYNQRMADVPNGATMTRSDLQKHLQAGTAWFVYLDEQLLGIGIAADGKIDAVIALQKGAGEVTLLALCSTLTTKYVELEVASANVPAIRLYDRLGFQKVAEISRWYTLLE